MKPCTAYQKYAVHMFFIVIKKGMRIIANVTSNQKLELVKMIRMQNQSNRNECRERERFLYGYPASSEYHGEIYGTEMTAVAEGNMRKEKKIPKETFLLSGFRLRFLLAVILMALFIYMDKTESSFFGKTMEEIAFYLTNNIRVEESFVETLNSFDL